MSPSKKEKKKGSTAVTLTACLMSQEPYEIFVIKMQTGKAFRSSNIQCKKHQRKLISHRMKV